MGRKSSFDRSQIYAAVASEVARKGRLTVQGLGRATGMSTGSVYHRFASREALLAETWLHAVRMFQTRFLDALRGDGPDAGQRAALATPAFCRAEPEMAAVLACCRKAEFVGPETPAALIEEIAAVNDAAALEIRRFARRSGTPILACRLALVAYPLAAVRLYLPDKPVPQMIDGEIVKAYRGAMDTGVGIG